jgi:hypothetical protein
MKRGSQEPVKRVGEHVKKIRAVDLVNATMNMPVVSNKAAKTYWKCFIERFEPTLFDYVTGKGLSSVKLHILDEGFKLSGDGLATCYAVDIIVNHAVDLNRSQMMNILLLKLPEVLDGVDVVKKDLWTLKLKFALKNHSEK